MACGVHDKWHVRFRIKGAYGVQDMGDMWGSGQVTHGVYDRDGMWGSGQW